MRLRVIFVVSLLFILLFGCSRESSIKENLSLRNNHSIVFVFPDTLDNMEPFRDSIRNLDSVWVPDTISITVHDTLYFMGFLRLNAEKVYRYAWQMQPNDSARLSANGIILTYAYDSVGVYSPLFIAIDGNGARDTTGKDQFIRVIDTPPNLSLPADTLWIRAAHDAAFAITTSDSLGVITKISIDWNGDKKADTSYVPIFSEETEDSLFIVVPFDSANLNSDFNQTVRISILDEDGNTTTDSLVIHFNETPTIELLQPTDNGRYSKDQRFAFYYKAEDQDNPDQLRYFIRVGKSPTGDNTPPILTDANLIAGPIKEKSFEAIDENGTWFMDAKLIGRLYWQVYVTDGFDTTTSKTQTFFLGNITETTGTFRGTVLLEGRTIHSGIKIEFLDSLDNRFYTNTNDKGVFTIDLTPGFYHMTAKDTLGYGYTPELLKNKFIEAGDIIDLGSITLQDPSAPIVSIEEISDTLNYRDFTLTGRFADYGSQVKAAHAFLDDDSIEVTTVKLNTWSMQLKNISDGLHTFKIIAIDSAGLISDTAKISFFIQASSISLLVNGKNTVMVNSDTALVFKASVENLNPPSDSIVWTWLINGITYTQTTPIAENQSTLTLTKELIKKLLPNADDLLDEILYEMEARPQNKTIKAKVRFGFIGGNSVVYFTSPKTETTISMNDMVLFAAEVQLGDGAVSYDVSWTCSGALSSEHSCPIDKQTKETNLAWTDVGEKTVIISVTDTLNTTSSDTIKINVISDPPVIKINSTADTLTGKINSSQTIEVSASDKYGTIDSLQWGCSNGNVIFDNTISFLENPLESISKTITLSLPGTETDSYHCIVKAIDDDKETALDTIFFRVILDKPTVVLHTKNATVKINSVVQFKASASDSLGTIEHYYMACNSNLSQLSWEELSIPDTSITMPSQAATWYCVIKVVDNDNLSAEDTAKYTVVLDPPTVIASEDYLTATIKDEILLDAMTSDAMGYIALYEWSCGPEGTAGNNFAWSSKTTPRYTATMPSVARNNYLCIIRVTDDDGQTAMDTTHINVLLDPPKVTVTQKNILLREGLNIPLNATASDSLGSIVKKEWSCGILSQINSQWKEVSQFDTIWKAPSSSQINYVCVARATDDDGNQATDTTHVNFSSEIPIVNVANKNIYVKAGDYFDLDATINDVWNGIEWYRWVCGTPNSSALTDTSLKWTYSKSFAEVMDPSYTTPGKDLLCIVFVSEMNTHFVAKDTSHIIILNDPPVGVISAPDTTFIWSGDESVPTNGKYYYSQSINASNSIPGTLGNSNLEDFWWQFSNYDPTYWYQGETDGSIDTSIAEFNEAFIRRQTEGSITLRLDYRDSTTTETDPDYKAQFLYRHKAEQVSKTIRFRKAWNNESHGTDSVVATTDYPVAPHMILHNDKPTIAFVNQSKAIEVRQYNGTSWNLIGSAIQASGTPSSVQLAANSDQDLFLAYLDSTSHQVHILKSNGGTSAWTEYASTISSYYVEKMKLKIRPSTKAPVLAWIGNTSTTKSKNAYYQAWNTSSNKFDSAQKIFNLKMREFDIAFDASSNWLAVGVDTTTSYSLTYLYYNSSNNEKKNASLNNISGESIQLLFKDGVFYLSFRNRDNGDMTGFPQIYSATNNAGNGVSWNTSGAIHSGFGRISYNVSMAINSSNNPIVVFDENIRATSSQIHAYRFDGDSWNLLGENELPYFKNLFVSSKGYYLRGHQPNVVITSKNEIFIAMRALEQPGSASTVLRGINNGPLVMKYLGDSWE